MTFIKNALISVSNKHNLDRILPFLKSQKFNIYSTGGTYNFIKKYNYPHLYKVSDLTNFDEILSGRVKTLHPQIMGGILANNNDNDNNDLKKHNISRFSLVISNLYPFKEATQKSNDIDIAIENIDIGGHTMIRAAAKNYKNIDVLTSPSKYDSWIDNYGKNIEKNRLLYAKDAFRYISEYDNHIDSYFNDTINVTYYKEKSLKYGLNPYNQNAFILSKNNKMPFTVLNGNIGYINTMDAMGSWNLVNEIKEELNMECSASFKHTIPAGVAVENYDHKWSPICNSYIKARNCDPLSSFGDFIAISGKVDIDTAKYIKNQVTDGIIAKDYDIEALELLKKKKSGKYLILRGEPIENKEIYTEYKDLYDITLCQDSDNTQLTSLYKNIVSNNKLLTDKHYIDLTIASVSNKYAQSNSIAMAYNGQLVGLGAGQQNRLDCIRLAGEKSKLWYLRRVYKHQFKNNTNYSEIYDYLRNELKKNANHDYFKLNDICMSSDGFMPFLDNVLEARKYGVTHIIQPGGSIKDNEIIDECNKNNMVMIKTGYRLFYH
tara:strand:+ start:2341 stop:3981 length:1641 start_codon:yes stop_codon:yes gene_type:complete